MVKGTGVFMPRSYDEVTAGRSEGQQHVNRTVAPITQQHLDSRATSSQSCRTGDDGDATASRSTVRGGTTGNSLRTLPGASRYRRSCSLPLCTSELCEDAVACHSLSHSYSSSLGDHTLSNGYALGLGHLDDCGSVQHLQVAAAAADQPSKSAGMTASTSSGSLYTTELGRCVPASHCQDHSHSAGAQHSSWRPSSALAAAGPSHSRQTAQLCSGLDYPGSLGSPTGRHMPLASTGGHRCTAAAAGAMALPAGGQGPPAAAAANSSSSSFALQPQNSMGWHTGPPQGPSATDTALTDPFLSTGKRAGMHPAVLQLGQHTTHGCSAPLQLEQQQQHLLPPPPSPAAAVEPGSLPDTLMLLQQQLAAAHMSDTGPIDDAAAASGAVFSDWAEALASSCSSLDRSLTAVGDTRLAFYQQHQQQQQQQQQERQQGFSNAPGPLSIAGSAGVSYGLSSLFDSSCGSLLDLSLQGQTQQEESYAAPASSSVGAAGSLYGSSPQPVGAFTAEHDVGALAAVVAQQKIQQMAVLEMLQQKLQQEVVTLLPYI